MQRSRWVLGWVWILVVFGLLTTLGRAARAQGNSDGSPSIIRVCVKPPNVQKEVRVWAYTSGSAQVIPRNDFEKNYPGTTSYVFDPFAPPENTRLLPIPYNKLPCAPKPDPAPETPAAPKDPNVAAKGGSGSGGGGAGAGASAGGAGSGSGSGSGTGTKKKDDPDEPPPGVIRFVGPRPFQDVHGLPLKGGVTESWPQTVLPVVVRKPILPSVESGHGVLPMAGLDGRGVLPFKHQVEQQLREAKEAAAAKAEAAKKASQPKTFFEKCAEQAALAGGLANLQLGEDIHDKDGDRYGVPGGKNPNGIKSPVAQAVAGGVMIAAVVLTAGGADKKFFEAIVKDKPPLIITGSGKAAEEAADKLIAQAITKSATHGAEDLAGALAHNGAIGEYSVMARFTKGLGGRFQAHHILEVKMARDFLEISATDKLPAVLLTDAEHKVITSRLAAKRASVQSAEDLWNVYLDVYKGHPTWLAAIRRYFGK